MTRILRRALCCRPPITPVLLVTDDATISMDNQPVCTGSSCIRGVLHKPLNPQEVQQKIMEAADYLRTQ